MKIGLSLFGVSYGQGIGYTGTNRDWNLTKHNLKESLIDCFSTDHQVSTYLTTYPHDTVEELCAFYNAKKITLLPFEGSHPRLTRLKSVEDLLEEDLDFIISTRFDIQWAMPITQLSLDFEKFNFVFRETEHHWLYDRFVADIFFAFPKKYLTTFIGAIKREHQSPYRPLPDLHAMFRHVANEIGQWNCNFMIDGCWESHNNPHFKLVRA